MWLFTTHGFYSVVQNSRHKSSMLVRARLRSHLEALQEKYAVLAECEILTTREADYRYRMVVPEQVWWLIVTKLTEEIDYSNFKEAVFKENKRAQQEGNVAYQAALHSVWDTMQYLQIKVHGGRRRG